MEETVDFTCSKYSPGVWDAVIEERGMRQREREEDREGEKEREGGLGVLDCVLLEEGRYGGGQRCPV